VRGASKVGIRAASISMTNTNSPALTKQIEGECQLSPFSKSFQLHFSFAVGVT
jgi:hypothetical protein